MVLASHDVVAPTADGRAAFELLPNPKELVMVEGHHFSAYKGQALIGAATAARDFFVRWL